MSLFYFFTAKVTPSPTGIIEIFTLLSETIKSLISLIAFVSSSVLAESITEPPQSTLSMAITPPGLIKSRHSS